MAFFCGSRFAFVHELSVLLLVALPRTVVVMVVLLVVVIITVRIGMSCFCCLLFALSTLSSYRSIPLYICAKKDDSPTIGRLAKCRLAWVSLFVGLRVCSRVLFVQSVQYVHCLGS